MRENWNRATDTLHFTARKLTELVRPLLPEQSVTDAKTAEGGLANTNIRIKTSGSNQRLLLRVFVRDPAQARTEYSLYRLFAANVPSTRVLHFSPSNPITGHPYMLMERVDGERLETTWPGLGRREFA